MISVVSVKTLMTVMSGMSVMVLKMRFCVSAMFKGTEARDFLYFFFHGSTLYKPQISRLKGFSFLFRFHEAIRIFR
jgi:hypothetical protein